MRLKSILFVACAVVVSLFAVHCIMDKPAADGEFALGNNAPVVPMTIKVGTTSHHLTDYYPQWVGADEVTTTDERLKLTATADDWSTFDITTDAEGEPLILVFNRIVKWQKRSLSVVRPT